MKGAATARDRQGKILGGEVITNLNDDDLNVTIKELVDFAKEDERADTLIIYIKLSEN